MSGPNEHHIPQFLQRAFAAKRKGKEWKIWLYSRGADPELASISKTASEDHFYGSDLDAKLSVPEDRLGARFAVLRKEAIGTVVSPALAADLVMHLAPRSKHLRTSLASAFSQLTSGAHELFTDPNKVSAILGLDGDKPGDQFIDKFTQGLERRPEIAAVGLPRAILERVAFYLAKEQSDSSAKSTAAWVETVLDQMTAEAPSMVRNSHNEALEKLTEDINPRSEVLKAFSWRIEAAPVEGATSVR